MAGIRLQTTYQA